MRDPNKYRISDINRDWARVYQGDRLVGHVRRGLDHLWYPELVAEKFKNAAVQAVMIADQAIQEYVRPLTEYLEDGDGNG
jgi:hypothetical protein